MVSTAIKQITFSCVPSTGSNSVIPGGSDDDGGIKETVKNAIKSDPTLVKAVFTEDPCLLQKVIAALGGIEGALKGLGAVDKNACANPTGTMVASLFSWHERIR